MAGPPVSARERLGLNTLLTPPPPPKHSPDMSRSARVRLAARAAEARYEVVRAWLPEGRCFSEGEVAHLCNCARELARATLKRLVAEGIIRSWPSRGYSVVGWQPAVSLHEQVLSMLRERGPMRMGELATALGVSVEATQRAAKNMGKTRIQDGRVTLREGV